MRLFIENFIEAGASEITVHFEACIHLHRTLEMIRSLGVKAGVALNPATPISSIEHVIGDFDVLLIMTVNPGFGGQKFIESSLAKIEKARKMLDVAGYDCDIAVDGGIDVNTAPKVVASGANVLIAGSSVFANHLPVKQSCDALRESVASVHSFGTN